MRHTRAVHLWRVRTVGSQVGYTICLRAFVGRKSLAMFKIAEATRALPADIGVDET
jgi:hypothetical protein